MRGREDGDGVIDSLRRWGTGGATGLTILALIVLFVTVYFWPRIFIRIQPGHAGVLYRLFAGGTVVDKVYGEGLHVIAPWNHMTIYDVREHVTTREVKVLTAQGLPVTVTVVARFKPERDVLGVLQAGVGPDYAQKIVMPEVLATVRRVLGTYSFEEISQTKRSLIQKLLTDSLAQAQRRYVVIDSVLITRLSLPKFMNKAIETKLEQQQLAEAYTFRLERARKEAERKRIEAQGIKTYNTIISSSLNPDLLTWQGIQATRDLATSKNAKVVVIGSGRKGLPLILNPDH